MTCINFKGLLIPRRILRSQQINKGLIKVEMMIKKKNKARKWDRKKQFLCGNLMNNHGVECLSSALVQPAELARYLVVNYDLLPGIICISILHQKLIN